MKKTFRLMALTALLGNVAPALQARSLRGAWQAAREKAARAAQKAYRAGQRAAHKAKDLWENPNVRKAAGVTAAVVAASAGAYLLYRSNQKVARLEEVDTTDVDNMRTVLGEIGTFARKMNDALSARRVNAEFIGANAANLTARTFDELAQQIRNLVNQYAGLLETKVINVPNPNPGNYPNLKRQADGYRRILEKLARFNYKEVLMQELALPILGLSAGASSSDVKRAYRKMARMWHPDQAGRRGVSKEDAEDKFKLIGMAYNAAR